MSELGKIQKSFNESLQLRLLTGTSKEMAVVELRMLLESCVADAMEVATDPFADQAEFAELARTAAQLALFTSWCRSEGL